MAVSGWNAAARGDDWPQSRGDAARSGFTAERLPAKLSLAWTYRPRHPPDPAWPRDDRMLFDRAADVVVANGLLFFGSSADGRVSALDAATGQERWTFVTEAPVRFAPAVWKDHLFVVSGAMADSGVSAQGYLVATEDRLLVPRAAGSTPCLSAAWSSSPSLPRAACAATRTVRGWRWPAIMRSELVARPIARFPIGIDADRSGQNCYLTSSVGRRPICAGGWWAAKQAEAGITP